MLVFMVWPTKSGKAFTTMLIGLAVITVRANFAASLILIANIARLFLILFTYGNYLEKSRLSCFWILFDANLVIGRW